MVLNSCVGLQFSHDYASISGQSEKQEQHKGLESAGGGTLGGNQGQRLDMLGPQSGDELGKILVKRLAKDVHAQGNCRSRQSLVRVIDLLRAWVE